MASIFLRSEINGSASRAAVYLNTARGEYSIARIFRADGFWNVVGSSGARLLPLMPHTNVEKGKATELPLGVVIKLLREKIGGAMASPSTRNAA